MDIVKGGIKNIKSISVINHVSLNSTSAVTYGLGKDPLG